MFRTLGSGPTRCVASEPAYEYYVDGAVWNDTTASPPFGAQNSTIGPGGTSGTSLRLSIDATIRYLTRRTTPYDASESKRMVYARDGGRAAEQGRMVTGCNDNPIIGNRTK
eukprot:666061-Prymnesium_polylepis.1